MCFELFGLVCGCGLLFGFDIVFFVHQRDHIIVLLQQNLQGSKMFSRQTLIKYDLVATMPQHDTAKAPRKRYDPQCPKSQFCEIQQKNIA